MKKKMGNREKTFLCITIPILILFFMFNTLPLIRGVIYSFTTIKAMEIMTCRIQKLCRSVSGFQSWKVLSVYL